MSPVLAVADHEPLLLPPDADDGPLAHWKPVPPRRTKGSRSAAPAAPSAKPKFKTHGHHQSQHARGIPLLELRRERDLWLAGQRQLLADERGAASRSAPAAPSSWPPAAGVSREDAEDENQHPNRWRSPGGGGAGPPLSTSAPRESQLSRSHGSSSSSKRVMTLFESAAFFNESGNLLNHDDLAQLGSSPADASKRKPKRRVGRRKTEKLSPKRDAGNQEDVVLELMAQLLPHVDVGKELNLLLLTGPSPHSHNSGVFHFEEDDATASRTRKAKSKNAELEVDLLKFQAALTKMVFEVDEPIVHESDELLEQYCSDQWVTRSVLATVKLDARVQHDRFAVLLAVFRAMRQRRSAILEAAASTALAIYHHQGADASSGLFADVEFVSMKGLTAFLAGVLGTLEVESVHAARASFGDDVDEEQAAVNAHCDELARAVKLLLRSSPGKPRRQDENNQLEKFNEDSESLEATTYGALGEVVYRLATFSPAHGEELLRWLLCKWPARNVQLQLFFLRFTGGLLARFFMCGLFFPEDVVRAAFARIAAHIRSPHFLLAKEACGLCGDLPLMDVHLSRDRALRELVASALHESARSHWNARIRELADEHFDLLLDLA